jgi:hypothetical protein
MAWADIERQHGVCFLPQVQQLREVISDCSADITGVNGLDLI